MNPPQLGGGLKYKFILIGMLIMLLSVSAVNAAELSNITADSDVLSLDVSQDNSTELSSENEMSTLIQNNTISDFNGEYAINSTDLSSNLINIDTSNIDYTGLVISYSNDMGSNLKSSSVPSGKL